MLKLPEMSTKLEGVLKRFDLALYKEIKYRNYQSTFSDLQNTTFKNRSNTH